eukprot:TRINITY_DN3016_c0_g1_i1.p1 TRINITY_DN3016_c0_g1~~TRINITY_DN3016_c0_g1_i1.p1  ORF type:complete len:287 (+),score=27.19 TRINITY_DN3016_c0_g1_i1:235-1095(+)
MVFGITALICFIFTMIIAFKYNSVKVFNRKIRTQNISNTMWIIYFLTFGVKSTLETVRYAISTEPNIITDADAILFLISLVLQGVSAFGLSLSLNHQRKYRSSAPPTAPAPVDNEPLLGKSDHIIKMISVSEIFFFCLFIIYLVFLYLATRFNEKAHLGSKSEIFTYMFLGIYIVQRIPVIVLANTIVAHRNGNEGPSRQSKAILMIAAILHLANGIPLFAWAQLLGSQACLHQTLISWVDIVSIFNVVSLILFFWFLRAEYLRNMEECIWTTVSQIQDTFDFRRF